MWWQALAVGLGGVCGALVRHAASATVGRVGDVPAATLAVNLTGCLLIGLAAEVFAQRGVRAEVRLGVLVGFLGSLTTFSTFAAESAILLRTRPMVGVAYLLLSNAAGLGLVVAGGWVAKLGR